MNNDETLARSASRAVWSRAFGGTHAADAPNSTADLSNFRGDPLTALKRGEKAFVESQTGASSEPTALFLVGGPGAGKSSAAKHILASYKEVDLDDSDLLAKRVHSFKKGTKSVLLVNDATMVHTAERGSTLSADLDWAELEQSDILVCVNRGILAEESVTEPTSSSELLISLVASEFRDSLSHFEDVVERDRGFVHLKNIGPGYYKNIVVVYLDSESLFDPSPEVEERDLLHSPAAKMMANIFTSLSAEHKEIKFPDVFEGNIEAMNNEKIFRNILKVLRASEVAVGSYMNYRTIWATIGRASFGNLPEIRAFDSRFGGMDSDLKSLSWSELQGLASLRLHQALFGADNGLSLPGPRQANKIPVKYLHAVDPVFAAVEVNAHHTHTEVEKSELWSQIVLDSFFGSSHNVSPLDSLEQSLDDENPFMPYVSTFDRSLDAAYLNEMASTDVESKRQDFTNWYSQYLLRAYALANGHVGNEQEIAILRELKDNPGPVPRTHDFDKSFRAMLRPSRYSESSGVALLSVFESRVAPILENLDEPKLAIKVTDVAITSRLQGGDAFLVLEEQGREIGSIIVDLPLVHEVLTWSSGMQGISEASRLVAPRIERLRASKLASGYLENSLVIALESDETDLIFGGPRQ